MQGHIATFSSPLRWLSSGFKALRQSIFGMMTVTMFYVFTMSFLGSLPFAGLVAAALFMPFGTMLIVRATQQAHDNEQITYRILVEMVREPSQRSRQIQIGLIYGAFLVSANFAFTFLALDTMRQWQLQNGDLVWSTVWNNMPWFALIVTVIIFTAGQMATWFAPMLVGWKNMKVGKALFYSFFGCLRNWLPILVLTIILVTITIGGGMLASLLLISFSLSSYSIYILAPFAFFVSALAYSTIWPMWIDIYGDIAVESDD